MLNPFGQTFCVREHRAVGYEMFLYTNCEWRHLWSTSPWRPPPYPFCGSASGCERGACRRHHAKAGGFVRHIGKTGAEQGEHRGGVEEGSAWVRACACLAGRDCLRGFAEAARTSITAVQADAGGTWEWAAAMATKVDDGAFA